MTREIQRFHKRFIKEFIGNHQIVLRELEFTGKIGKMIEFAQTGF